MRGRRKEALLQVRESQRVAGDVVGDGADGGGGGSSSVGVRVGHGIGVIGVVVVAEATAGIGVEQRVLVIGVREEVGVVGRRTGRERLGRHGGVAGSRLWRIQIGRAHV